MEGGASKTVARDIEAASLLRRWRQVCMRDIKLACVTFFVICSVLFLKLVVLVLTNIYVYENEVIYVTE